MSNELYNLNISKIDKTRMIIKKLAVYEDLDERLIKIYGNHEGLLETIVETLEEHPNIDIPNDTVKALLLTNEQVDIYKEYQQLEKQDKLVKLPCKYVWRIVDTKSPKYAFTIKSPITELKIYEIKDIDKIGCQYFSTKEKAETRLRELRGGENEERN